MDKIIAKFEAMTAGEIFEVLKGLVNTLTVEAGIVTQAGLDVLERKIPEAKFLEVCDALEQMEEAA